MDAIEEHLRWLRAPVYQLYYVEVGENLSDAAGHRMWHWRNVQTDPLYREPLLAAFEWAVQNPDFEYSQLLPDIPFSNDEIFRYLMRVRELVLQQEGPQT